MGALPVILVHKKQKTFLRKILLAFLLLFFGLDWQAAAGDISAEIFQVTGTTRCPVCGMFVAKHQQWQAQVRMTDGTTAAFDGVKDMMAYYFAPQDFGAKKVQVVGDVAVQDYYSQAWTDGRAAVYVLGGDILGPMGLELIPFSGRAGAENFSKDHGGTKILKFSEITPELIESLRQNHMIQGRGMKAMKN